MTLTESTPGMPGQPDEPGSGLPSGLTHKGLSTKKRILIALGGLLGLYLAAGLMVADIPVLQPWTWGSAIGRDEKEVFPSDLAAEACGVKNEDVKLINEYQELNGRYDDTTVLVYYVPDGRKVYVRGESYGWRVGSDGCYRPVGR